MLSVEQRKSDEFVFKTAGIETAEAGHGITITGSEGEIVICGAEGKRGFGIFSRRSPCGLSSGFRHRTHRHCQGSVCGLCRRKDRESNRKITPTRLLLSDIALLSDSNKNNYIMNIRFDKRHILGIAASCIGAACALAQISVMTRTSSAPALQPDETVTAVNTPVHAKQPQPERAIRSYAASDTEGPITILDKDPGPGRRHFQICRSRHRQ